MIDAILSFFASLFSVFLKHKENTSESLGKAEEVSSEESVSVNVLEEEAKASANAPQNKTEMENLLEEHKL